MADTETGTLYRYGIKITPKGNHDLQFKRPKLEIGTVATDWSPAPEDPDEELYERISVLQTDFSVVQGEIQAKVWETDIEKATDGLYESMNEIYAYIDETVNGISASVGDLTYTVENNYSILTAQISDLVITSDGLYSRVETIEQQLLSANIFNNVQRMNMDTPYRLSATNSSSSASSLVSSWEVNNDDIAPTNVSYYAIVVVGSSASTTGSDYYISGFHWDANSNIIDLDNLTNGETYTFSFYIATEYVGIFRLFFDEMIESHQTINGYGQRTGTDSTWGTYYQIQGTGNIIWFRIWFSFKYDSAYASSFKIGPAWGMNDIFSIGSTPFFVAGFMLNEGDSPADWEDGLSGFATTALLYSEINQLSDSITARVVSLEDNVNAQIEILSDSITATVSNLTNTVESRIEQLERSITLSVSSQSNGSASIVMTVDGVNCGSGDILADGVRQAFAGDHSAITISAGTVTFNSNTFIVNSTYFSVTAAGVITATSGRIGGWTIGTSSLYNGATGLTSTTTGNYLGTDGIRSNSGIGTVISNGQISFYNSSNEVCGQIYARENNSGWGLWMGHTGHGTYIAGNVWVEQVQGSGSLVQTQDLLVELVKSNGDLITMRFSNGMLTNYI